MGFHSGPSPQPQPRPPSGRPPHAPGPAPTGDARRDIGFSGGQRICHMRLHLLVRPRPGDWFVREVAFLRRNSQDYRTGMAHTVAPARTDACLPLGVARGQTNLSVPSRVLGGDGAAAGEAQGRGRAAQILVRLGRAGNTRLQTSCLSRYCAQPQYAAQASPRRTACNYRHPDVAKGTTM